MFTPQRRMSYLRIEAAKFPVGARNTIDEIGKKYLICNRQSSETFFNIANDEFNALAGSRKFEAAPPTQALANYTAAVAANVAADAANPAGVFGAPARPLPQRNLAAVSQFFATAWGAAFKDGNFSKVPAISLAASPRSTFDYGGPDN